MQKRKGIVRVHDSAHAPDEQSHWEKIFRYQGRSVSNAAKHETKWHNLENAVGRGFSYVKTRKEQYGYYG